MTIGLPTRDLDVGYLLKLDGLSEGAVVLPAACLLWTMQQVTLAPTPRIVSVALSPPGT